VELIAVVGSTATGKSELALDLAERLGAEIVGADAMQLYRGMDIGTAKVPPEERRGIPHHQIDVLGVREEASVAAYQRAARRDIRAAWERGRPVILVGGSGLYVRAVLDKVEFPGTDPAVRRRWEERAAQAGPEALHGELAALDPAAALAIEPANVRRIVRALEVIELTGRPFSATLPAYEYQVPAVQIGVAAPAAELDAAIAARARRMLAAGLIEEVRALEALGLREGRTASRAIGYSQGLAVIDGALTAQAAVESIALATRQLARRQRKWFRRDPRITWIESGRGAAQAALAALAEGE
jgi:tRNA dimethylallyltransferase